MISVYLEGKEYTITSLDRWHVEFLDPALAYPVSRLETRENFERLLRQDQQNGHITEFLFTDPERFDQDLREVLTSGLLNGQDKDYISQWLRMERAIPRLPSACPNGLPGQWRPWAL